MWMDVYQGHGISARRAVEPFAFSAGIRYREYAMEEHVRQCYWEDGCLVVETSARSYRIRSTDGIKALKANRLLRSGHADLEHDLELFRDDDPRRMALIQEQLSGLKD